MAYATPQDVEDRFVRPLDEQETKVVNTRLGDVEILLKNRIPTLDQKITDGDIKEEEVVLVEAEAVLRLIRNPEGYSEESDGSYSYSISARVASGALEIKPHEWALLGAQGGVFTVSTLPKMPWSTS